MASQRPFNRFNSYAFDIARGLIKLDSDRLYIMLSNVAPLRSNSRKAELIEISAGNGYAAGGEKIEGSAITRAGPGALFTGGNILFFANGGRVGPFQFAVLYDATAAGALIGWWDYMESLTLADGDSLLVEFDARKILAVGA